MKTPGCRCCGSKINQHPVDGHPLVFVCGKCGALYGDALYLGNSLSLVLPFWGTEKVAPEDLRYFDLDHVGSEGVGRRHGWYDPQTKKIHQIG